MDITDTQKTWNEPSDIEEKLKMVKGSSDSETEDKEKACQELTEEKTTPINKETLAKHKEPIEILKVELVLPRRDQNDDDADDTKDSAVNCESAINCENIPVIKKEDQSLLNLGADVIENAVKNQLNNDVNLEDNKTETSDMNVQISQVEVLNSNEPTTNTSCLLSTTKTSAIKCENILVIKKEKQSLVNLGTDVIENAVKNQLNNDVNLEDNKTESSDMDVQISQVEVLNSTEPTTIASCLLSTTKTTGLSLLAQYDSDDDTDSVIEVPTSIAQDYRNQVVEIVSDSDSDDSTDSSDVEYLNELRKTIEKRIEVPDEDEEDEDDNEDNTRKKRHQTKLRVKGEMLLEDLPPIQDLQITVPEDECVEFGKIHSIVDQLVLVTGLSNSILLDLETVIFLEKGKKVLGEVFDVLGQVADPLYCVRFNSNKEIKEKQIKIGDVAYIAPKTQYTQYMILSSLMNLKGSDASWENDVEPPPRFLDYSDDEQEQLARRQLRNKDRPMDNEDPTKRVRTLEDDDFTSNRSENSNIYQRNRNTEQRNSRGGQVGPSNVNYRPRYNGPPQNQHCTPNHRRNSWHSNYYPQSFPPHATGAYGMHSAQNQPQSSQAYPPSGPVYAPPHVPNMQYPPPLPLQYGTPPMFQQHGYNTFSIRPPTLQDPSHVSHQPQYISMPPPPPKNQ